VNPESSWRGWGIPPSPVAQILVSDEIAEPLDEGGSQAVFHRRKRRPSVSEPDATRPVKHRNAAVPDPPAERCDACLDVPVVSGQPNPILQQISDDRSLGVRFDEQ
jgi:hypothetical protein